MRETTSGRVRAALASSDFGVQERHGANTAARLLALCEAARRLPISVARLVEAHVDAIGILAEADREPACGAVYGVWASQHPTHGVVYDATVDQIRGTMGFASGLGVVDRALVTALSPLGTVLVDVDLSPGRRDSVTFHTDRWSTPALVDTFTGAVSFEDHEVQASHVISEPGWYLDRVGFWQGACGPAACWAGGAIGLVDAADRFVDDDPHRRAHHGALLAQAWSLLALVGSAGDQIDAMPGSAAEAERVARSLRFAVTTICRDVMDRFGRAFGPRPYTEDGDLAQRVLDLDLYIKQHHAERELPAISLLGGPT